MLPVASSVEVGVVAFVTLIASRGVLRLDLTSTSGRSPRSSGEEVAVVGEGAKSVVVEGEEVGEDLLLLLLLFWRLPWVRLLEIESERESAKSLSSIKDEDVTPETESEREGISRGEFLADEQDVSEE